MSDLVLSLFPGIGMLDMAFEIEGFCVVRGPDVLWGGDIRTWHPPAGKFDGVIGGPPCQMFTQLRYLNPNAGKKHGNMIPEFERVVREAQPKWFLMEEVPAAPVPVVEGYIVRDIILNNRWLGDVQDRTRRFSFGTPQGWKLSVEVALFESMDYRQAVTSSLRAVPVAMIRDGNGGHKVKRTYTEEGKRHGPSIGPRAKLSEMIWHQGLPDGFLDEAPFTEAGKRIVIGNGVPIPMGQAIARAVRRALGLPLVETTSP